MRLKFTADLRAITLKNETKFEEELPRHFKRDIRILTNFDLDTRKSQNVQFNGMLLAKVYNV